ncbi:hypothetical protein ABIA30_001154 [Mycobacterium sp. MAA66]|uniref:hypothetical protein n=1 Tax=Mycobacterium sp. MAA66 TaxID=3156297 RepID=UPI0035188A2B
MSDDSRSRADVADARPKRNMVVANWAAALSTALGAAVVVVFAYVQVLGTAGCSDRACPHVGPGEFGFTVITYGAPIVAAVAILLSFSTARKPWAPVVPAAAWLLLIAAFVVLVVTFP